jgi:hypothetical protein
MRFASLFLLILGIPIVQPFIIPQPYLGQWKAEKLPTSNFEIKDNQILGKYNDGFGSINIDSMIVKNSTFIQLNLKKINIGSLPSNITNLKFVPISVLIFCIEKYGISVYLHLLEDSNKVGLEENLERSLLKDILKQNALSSNLLKNDFV